MFSQLCSTDNEHCCRTHFLKCLSEQQNAIQMATRSFFFQVKILSKWHQQCQITISIKSYMSKEYIYTYTHFWQWVGSKKIIFSFSYFLTRYLQILRFYNNKNKIIVKKICHAKVSYYALYRPFIGPSSQNIRAQTTISYFFCD